VGPRQLELVAALRSGRYKQIRGSLKRGDCFCADGVACDISGLGEWLDDAYAMDDIHSGYIPLEVMHHFKLTTPLFRLNDRDRMSFAEIADRLASGDYFNGEV
jgi:hypothetical protein